MHKRVFLILFTLVLILAIPCAGFADTEQVAAGAASKIPAPEISAPSAILVEAETGQILYYKDSDEFLHISSACKLMTILVAI